MKDFLTMRNQALVQSLGLAKTRAGRRSSLRWALTALYFVAS